MGRPVCVLFERIGLGQILCGLKKVKLGDRTALLFHTQNGQVCWFTGKSNNYLSLDANQVYFQIDVWPYDADRTAFDSQNGLSGLSHMRYGLFNDPGTFQCTINVISSPVKWKFAWE